jgi:hypothetical protein
MLRALPEVFLSSWLLALTALPGDPIFAVPIADTRAPLSSVVVRFDPSAGFELGPGQAIDATLATALPLVGAQHNGWDLQLSIAASAHMGFEADAQLTFGLRTFDGWFALPLDLRRGHWSARISWVHVSAHYADGIRNAQDLPEQRGSYSREAVTGLLSRELAFGRVYGGGHANIHTVHDEAPFMVQAGTEIFSNRDKVPYGAFDLKFHQEHGWEPSLGAQLGAKFVGDGGRFRVALVAYAGKDDTGKYLGQDERYLGFVLGFDTAGLLGF